MSEDICTLCRDKRCDGYLCQASRENLLEIAYRQNAEVAELEARRALLEKKYTRVVDAGNTTIQNLEADNERLRVRVADYAQQTHDAVDAHTKLLEDFRKLEAENAEHEARIESLESDRAALAVAGQDLRAENAELRGREDKLSAERTVLLGRETDLEIEAEALKKRLAWFSTREGKVSEMLELCFDGKAQSEAINLAERIRDHETPSDGYPPMTETERDLYEPFRRDPETGKVLPNPPRKPNPKPEEGTPVEREVIDVNGKKFYVEWATRTIGPMEGT